MTVRMRDGRRVARWVASGYLLVVLVLYGICFLPAKWWEAVAGPYAWPHLPGFLFTLPTSFATAVIESRMPVDVTSMVGQLAVLILLPGCVNAALLYVAVRGVLRRAR